MEVYRWWLWSRVRGRDGEDKAGEHTLATDGPGSEKIGFAADPRNSSERDVSGNRRAPRSVNWCYYCCYFAGDMNVSLVFNLVEMH